MSYSDKRKFIQDFLLTKGNHNIFTHINSIIVKYELDHTVNTNGIFLNLSLLGDEIIDEIYDNLHSSDKKNVDTEIPSIQPVAPPIKKQNEHVIQTDTIHLEKFDSWLLELSKQSIHI